MSDEAIAAEIGQRIEQRRLEANISQQSIANALGITPKTYRNTISGKGAFSNIIGILRALDSLDLIENFVPKKPFSPIELMKMEGNKRKRARERDNQKAGLKPSSEDANW
ncbi:helix-turn-helix transcriptional regulator [Spongiibacter sp. KMU-158]|uniref:Helix-turn-helix transcriptional regulator n=1 Tax=Spongiibacter pelagi TaxID=2760804 RepID=A0A927C5N2_9GAMM|nr:helix-turn-helix transcriptional regulator [Spongiibacter pelagi]MBD2860211.1 helix-turn-helix transcriptional regulator [Spongiibacter pelagi]